MFAALNTVEPPILNLEPRGCSRATSPGAARLPLVEDRVRDRLTSFQSLMSRLGRWSAPRGDLMMVSVLLS